MDHEDTNKINDDAEFSDSEEKQTQLKEKNISVNKVVKPGKQVKRGIIYLSTIPKYMTVAMIQEIFSEYGKVGRVYMQLDENGLSWIFLLLCFFFL